MCPARALRCARCEELSHLLSPCPGSSHQSALTLDASGLLAACSIWKQWLFAVDQRSAVLQSLKVQQIFCLKACFVPVAKPPPADHPIGRERNACRYPADTPTDIVAPKHRAAQSIQRTTLQEHPLTGSFWWRTCCLDLATRRHSGSRRSFTRLATTCAPLQCQMLQQQEES